MTGCPIGSLSQSLGYKSDKIRRRINFAFNHMRHFYLVAFTEAYERGEVSEDPAKLADLMLTTVQGVGVISRSTNSTQRVKKLVNNIMPILTG